MIYRVVRGQRKGRYGFSCVYISPARGRAGRVPGEIKRSSDLRGGRWSWTSLLPRRDHE